MCVLLMYSIKQYYASVLPDTSPRASTETSGLPLPFAPPSPGSGTPPRSGHGITFGTPPDRKKSIAILLIARTPTGSARSSP
jgi:hypothetical protein